jgi:hypothetical protein
MGGTHGTHWREEKCTKVLVRKSARKRTLGRRRRRWEDNIKTNGKV